MTEGSILVTGATGTVGSEVVKQLSAKGEIIRAATRSASDNTFRNLNSVRVVQLDYNNPDTLATAFKGVEKLFLLTPPQSSTVDFTSNLVREAKKAGVARISFVDVRDIAAIAVDALTSTNGKHEGKAHNITGGEALSHGQAAEILSEQLGKKVNYINVSDEDARKGMKDMGMDEWIINSILELFEFGQQFLP